MIDAAPPPNGRRLRAIYVQRAGDNPQGGDVIYEKRMIEALARTMDVHIVRAVRRSRAARVVGAVRHLSLPDQTGFGGDAEVAEIEREMARGCDVVVFSHEYLDLLARRLKARARARGVRFVTVRQNVTSDFIGQYLGGLPGAFAQSVFGLQEKAALKPGLFEGVVVLSKKDHALASALGGRNDIIIASPGPPPATPLSPDAELVNDLVVGGSFGWFAKRRDLVRFVEDYGRLAPAPGQILAESSIPADLAARMGARPTDGVDFSGALRFGVITDRFAAGHKLKTAAYIQSNCIVLTLADVAFDFDFDARHRQFIIRLSGVDDIAPAIARLRETPVAQLREDFLGFKASVARELDWSKQTSAFEALVRGIAQPV